MNHSLEGSCQCGEVHYQIKGEPLVLYRCHCTECQKQSGSGFGMSMWVRNDDFKILRGSLKHFHRIADSGGKIECFFCGNCGVRIYHKTLNKKRDYIVLKPGTLHNTQALQPTADIWLKSKQARFVPPDETDHFEGPLDFKEFLET